MLHCELIGLEQKLSFEENVTQTFLVLRLPTGTEVRAAVDDAAAAAIVGLQLESRGAPQPVLRTPAAPAASVPMEAEEEPSDDYSDPPVRVFGGDESEEAPPLEPPEEPEQVPGEEAPTPDALTPPAKQERKKGKKRATNGEAPFKTVPKDSHGYPVVPRGTGVDPQSITGSRDPDEEGIGSI